MTLWQQFIAALCAPFLEAREAWREPSTWIDRRTDAERKLVDDKRFAAKLRGERIVP